MIIAILFGSLFLGFLAGGCYMLWRVGVEYYRWGRRFVSWLRRR